MRGLGLPMVIWGSATWAALLARLGFQDCWDCGNATLSERFFAFLAFSAILWGCTFLYDRKKP